MIPEIENIMATVNLGCRLNLKDIASRGTNLEYNPGNFNPIVMRLRNPKSTALIFSTGKIVCTGTKNEEDSRIVARKFARILQKLGYPIKFLDYRITNIAASCRVNFRPNFEKIYRNQQKFVQYEPELFPALVYRKDLTILLFKSSKVIITNAKSRQQLYEGFQEFKESIHRLRY